MHRCVELVREDGQQLCVCVGAQVCGVSPGRMGNSCVCVGAQVCGVSPGGWVTAVCV